MVDGEASIHNIMGGMESTGGVRLHNHKRKLKQRFDIIKKLGQGTYGKVQLGINKETGQEVAIKTIKKCKIETEADLIRIRREIQIMSSVQHPNIIHIYEVFENREKMVLVMEYAAGGELYDYLSEQKVLTELEARRIFRQISTAIFYCHKHKICHRDLKLENILLDTSGNAKIADFGLSNVFDERRLLSTFCGSALYASPEIVNGTPYHGPEVDCWSLGVLLYTLVYGAMPFDGTNFKRLVKQISESDYREPRKPSRASPLIKAMLTVSPSRRVDIEKICTHWWVNEGYEKNCLDIAEDLASQTPVRLDLLLSLVPQSASAEKLVISSDHSPHMPDISNNMSSEILIPTRCHSVGSLMELDQNNSDRRIREMIQQESKTKTKTPVTTDAKRKLELTPSMEETTAAGIKRKEYSQRKEANDDKDAKFCKSITKHHSAPISSFILEETMDIDSSVVVSVPISKTVDLKKKKDSIPCLEVKEIKRKEKLSKEHNKSQMISDQTKNLPNDVFENSISTLRNKFNEKEKGSQKLTSTTLKKIMSQLHVEEAVFKTDVPDEKNSTKMTEPVNNKIFVQKNIEKISKNAPKKSKETLKKLKHKSLSLDCDFISNDTASKPITERRRSKIFETAEKFNQVGSLIESDKPKKIFIPGVNVGGAKLVFERKASLSSATVPQTNKVPISKVIIDVPTLEKSPDNDKFTNFCAKEKDRKRDEEKKRAVDIISGALGKPPMLRKASGSPPISPQNNETKKLGLKIPLGPNDYRNATITVTTPTETKFSFESKPELYAKTVLSSPNTSNPEISESTTDEQKKCSKMEIILKSATLPRPHKTSRAEITLSDPRTVDTTLHFGGEVKIDAFKLDKLRPQRSEVAFPVVTDTPHTYRSSSLEPFTRIGNRGSFGERVIPVQIEPIPQQATVHSTTPPPKPPVPQRSHSQRSNSLSRQSTVDSDTDSALGSIHGPEPIKKSSREYIIPIAVEGGGYVTPRGSSLEPENKSSTSIISNSLRSRFGRTRKIGSFLSDASEDESSFSIHRDNDDLLQRHMHRLRSSRPPRQASDHADSLSSGEDDDDDGFELLTAENLFSTLLSRVRSLTQRLNVDDNRASGFTSNKMLNRLSSNTSQGLWKMHEPISRRISESQYRKSMSRDNNECFGHKESTGLNSPCSQQNCTRARTSSHDNLFDLESNTLPRTKALQLHQPSSSGEIHDSPEQSPERNSELSFTSCFTRRLSRHFIERTRQSLPRDSTHRSSLPSTLNGPGHLRSRSQERKCPDMRRTNSLFEPTVFRYERRSPRRSISLFDNEDRYLPPLPLSRKYRDSVKLSSTPIVVDKIQEEQSEPTPPIRDELEDNSLPEYVSLSLSNCTKIMASNKATLFGDTLSTESTSNILDYNFCKNNSGTSNSLSRKELHSRLLAAENLVKESKLKNFSLSKYNQNLNSNYKDLEKCDKEALGAMSETAHAAIAKRRSCIPSLRSRSGSLSRENSLNRDKSIGFNDSQDTMVTSVFPPERSLLSKLFKSNVEETKDMSEVQKKPNSRQRRISRFLRPDFFDTPREESQYIKEKEAQKAAENERRKSRFIKRKNESRIQEDERSNKGGKNEVNILMKNNEDNPKSQNVKSSFLQTLERKFEKFCSADDDSKTSDKNESETSTSIKRTSSTGNLSMSSSIDSTHLSPKTKVNSMLGLFTNTESKLEQNSSGLSRAHEQTILNRLKKNPCKTSSSNVILTPDISASKIPTKFYKNEIKLSTKLTEISKSQEKIMLGFNKSPSKEKEKEMSLVKRFSPETKKITIEKFSKSLKKSSSKLLKEKMEKTEKLLEENKDISFRILENKKHSDIIISKKNSSTDNMPLNFKSSKILDNKQIEDTNEIFDEKNMPKLKKKVLSSTTTFENTSGVKLDKVENGKTVKKGIKVKNFIEKDKDGDENTKKKRIVRVVRKVVKKSSDNLENKEEKEKPTIKTTIKKAFILKTDKRLELPVLTNDIQIKSSENETYLQNEKISELKMTPTVDITSINKNNKNLNMEKICNSVEMSSSKIINNVVQSEITEDKSNKEKLKIDFSKIPQRDYRNIMLLRRESLKSEVSEIQKFVKKSQSDNMTEKLTDNLSKPTYKATITGNKIVTNRPLQTKNFTDLKTKIQTSNSIISRENIKFNSINNSQNLGKNYKEEARENKISDYSSKCRSSTDNLASSTEETENFDSWSICSADINHTRGDLYSPTSSTYSIYIHGDNVESVVDRIRRKSFYSRFNDRKRKVFLNAPTLGINISSSMTLPRKFSFNSLRDISKDKKKKANNYTLPNRKSTEKYYSMCSDDATLFRKSPIERDKYSDGGSSSSYSNDLKSPNESYGHISSSFDPLRKNSLSHPDSILEPNFNINTNNIFPKRYGCSLSVFEPKSVAYYEELLTPNNIDYLQSRRVFPFPYENCNKFESGYHNENGEPLVNTERWKSYFNKTSETDLTQVLQAKDCARTLIQSMYESDDLSSNSLDPANTSITD